MSWLLFLDESGHDHRTTPYEVTGGVAIHARKIWPFVQAVQSLEVDAFGIALSQFNKEFKGAKLLDRDRYRWTTWDKRYEDEERRKHVRRFLTKGLEKKAPTREEYAAYGQAA